ncbi:MAG: hypothetical protein EAY75_15890 [Bacteroidetes bacterium]|nr:MAG: hypothetical protein EAY75_15890 [Bacteroidota bacterium]
MICKKQTMALLIYAATLSQAMAQNVGIGTPAPSEKLHVNGNFNLNGLLKINGNAGTANQVLTSTGAGSNPIWATTAYTGGGRFRVTINNNTGQALVGTRNGFSNAEDAPFAQEDSVDFMNPVVVGTDFSMATAGTTNNIITVNRTGLYHFEGLVRLFATSQLSITMLPRATLRFLADQPLPANDINLILVEDAMAASADASSGGLTNQYNYAARFNLNIHLESGTKLTLSAGFNNLRTNTVALINIGQSLNSYMLGHFISE